MEEKQWSWEELIKKQLQKIPQFVNDDIDDFPVRGTRLLSEIYEKSNVAVLEPSDFKEVEMDDKWIEAMKEELKMIEKNDTWELVDRPQHKQPIGVKWVYRTKLNADGYINKYKARMLLALIAQKGWKVYHLDVKSAFLNGYLQEEIFVEQPEEFQVKGHEEKVYKLKTALYGLKHGPRAWYSRIDDYLQNLGFINIPGEATLYVKMMDTNLIIVSVYVDDLLVIGNEEKLIMEFKAEMLQVFEMTDLGLISFFLGMEVKQDHGGVFICQKKYAREILKKIRMEDCKNTTTPMNQKEKFSKDDGIDKVEEHQFRSLIGCLMYLTAIRPDIMFDVSMLSRFMHCASEVHLQAANRIVRYIKGTVDYGVKYTHSHNFQLHGYSDSDLGGSIDDMKSTTAVNQAIWLRRMLADLHMEQKEPTQILVDNQTTIFISNNPVFHGRTKHFKIKLSFLREAQREGEVKLIYCRTEDQGVDVLTKALPKAKFEALRNKLSV
uniref:Retrovirus-related Pol polyprotein from transposon TNT 1-94 n=1 Tax=Cajanus cajan TaxID=3821 RepID=A0A151QLS4_CAJCA|nr:Retrovirus-related Pol polyprotein from transposon TNT 1-94 [Cajanus cajan]